jgi:hypothetical protein
MNYCGPNRLYDIQISTSLKLVHAFLFRAYISQEQNFMAEQPLRAKLILTIIPPKPLSNGVLAY